MRRSRLMLAMSLVMLLGWASMSLGAIALNSIALYGVQVMRAQLLTNASATTIGEWIDVSGLASMSIHVNGITTATVEIDGSNAPIKPLDTVHEIKLNPVDIAVDQIVVLTLPVRWLKVRIPAYTSGTINAYLEGRSQ